ncbi:hypothetical protein [Streptomyces sp. NPDC046985]|uniref:hypothetical protein n=1 Tax=Streptomyces sp. NPDC046985 TaxID=3155377 RepID=UPI0033FD7E2D
MRYPDDVLPGAVTPARRPGRVAYDRHWARDAHTSVRSSAALLALLLLADWGRGGLTWWRGTLWLALAVLLLLVLWPPRVSAGEGWLALHAPLRRRRVRTDLLVSAHTADGVSQRLVLTDALGARLEVDIRVLEDNPDLWYRLAEDARTSRASGLLRGGAQELACLARRVDRATALSVFRVSGLDS